MEATFLRQLIKLLFFTRTWESSREFCHWNIKKANMMLCHPYWPSFLSIVYNSLFWSHFLSGRRIRVKPAPAVFSQTQRGREALLYKPQLLDFKYFINPLFSLTCRTRRQGGWGGEEKKSIDSTCNVQQLWDNRVQSLLLTITQSLQAPQTHQLSVFNLVTPDSDAERRATSPCVSKPVFSPEADLWSSQPANGLSKSLDVAFTKTDGSLK